MLHKQLPFYQSLNGRILITLIAIGVLPIAFIGVQMIRAQQRTLVEQAGQLLALDAASFSAELNWFINELQRDTAAIASLAEIRELDPVAQQRTLDTLKEGEFTQFGKLAIIDLSGDILISNPVTPTGTNIAHIDSFQQARSGEQAWLIAPALNGPQLVMHMHTPVFDDAGEVVAVLGSPIGLPVLSNLAADNPNKPAFVLDANGGILLAARNPSLSNSTNYADVMIGDEAYTMYDAEGQARLAGFAPVPQLGWTVVVERSLDSVLLPARQSRNLSIFAVLTAVGFSAMFAYVAANHLTHPVRELVDAAFALGKGDKDTPLPSVSSGEIGVLVGTFDAMREAVAEREQTLKQTEALLREERALLAQRVKMRTAELEETNHELAHALETKDKFVATMSHELRTPLNAVLGITDALAEGVYEPLRPKQCDMVMRVHESGAHLLELINDILNVAKMESGQFELEMGPTDVQGICNASLDLIRPNAEKKQIAISCQIDSRIRLIESDPLRLKQIIVNLLSNAVKFTPDGGQIGLEVTGDIDETWIQFAVWDTGIGVDAADFERVFQPFVQLDGSLSRRHMGTGLGLALSQQLAQLHSGNITIESETGVGSRFTLFLPWRQFGLPLATPLPEQDIFTLAESDRTAILLVEDNELGIATFQDYLEFKGFEVAVARNGQEALAYVDAETPDLILMDVQMPIMDGLECTRRLRQRANTAQTPIIALTGLAMQYDRELCLAAGANAYLAKPVELDTLVSHIHDHISAEITAYP